MSSFHEIPVNHAQHGVKRIRRCYVDTLIPGLKNYLSRRNRCLAEHVVSDSALFCTVRSYMHTEPPTNTVLVLSSS